MPVERRAEQHYIKEWLHVGPSKTSHFPHVHTSTDDDSSAAAGAPCCNTSLFDKHSERMDPRHSTCRRRMTHVTLLLQCSCPQHGCGLPLPAWWQPRHSQELPPACARQGNREQGAGKMATSDRSCCLRSTSLHTTIKKAFTTETARAPSNVPRKSQNCAGYLLT